MRMSDDRRLPVGVFPCTSPAGMSAFDRFSYVPIHQLPRCPDEVLLYPDVRARMLSPKVGWWLKAAPCAIQPSNVPFSKSKFPQEWSTNPGKHCLSQFVTLYPAMSLMLRFKFWVKCAVQSLSEWNSRRVHVFFSEIIKKNYSKHQFQIFYQGHVRLTEFRYKSFVTRRLRILIPEYDQSDGPKNSNLNRTWLWRWPYNGEKKTTVI